MSALNIYLPPPDSHKGQNGKLLIIGGSHLFHAASLWALKVASRIVDLVHYSSIEENNKIVQKLKEEFREGIVVPRSEIEEYIEEDDCVLIGPGMVRSENGKCLPTQTGKMENGKLQFKTQNLKDIENIKDESVQTYFLTKYLLQKYSHKKWVIDAGALQMLDPEWIPGSAILTPHHKEFEGLTLKISNIKVSSFAKAMEDKQISNKISTFAKASTFVKTTADRPADGQNPKSKNNNIKEKLKEFTRQYNCLVLLKGETDIIVSKDKIKEIHGGNAGMTKGGTGDVLAGLVAALYCKNDAWTSAVAASCINKKAGEELFKKMGYWYNASDLADQIPQTMKSLFIK